MNASWVQTTYKLECQRAGRLDRAQPLRADRRGSERRCGSCGAWPEYGEEAVSPARGPPPRCGNPRPTDAPRGRRAERHRAPAHGGARRSHHRRPCAHAASIASPIWTVVIMLGMWCPREPIGRDGTHPGGGAPPGAQGAGELSRTPACAMRAGGGGEYATSSSSLAPTARIELDTIRQWCDGHNL